MERPRSPALLDTLKHGRSQWNCSICWISTLPGAAQYQIENLKIWESERSQVWCSRPNWADVSVTPTWIEIMLSVRCAHQHALNIKKCNWDLQRCLRELADTENGRTSAVTETPTSNSWSPLCPTFDLPSSGLQTIKSRRIHDWRSSAFPRNPRIPKGFRSKVIRFPGFDGFGCEKADQWIDSRIHGDSRPVLACSG